MPLPGERPIFDFLIKIGKEKPMPSKIDSTAPDVLEKSEKQYKKGITKESMAPGDPERGSRPKEEINKNITGDD